MKQSQTNPPLVIDSLEQLTQAVRQARASQTPLVDYGLFHAQLGHQPPPSHTAFTQIGKIIEHDVNDFTVTTQTGITMGQLNEQLMAAGQFLPVNSDDDLTLGEVINHHVYGPMRVRYGSVRDLLLGLHYVDSFANDIQVGGRTVKNVAGLDVTRLMVGSLGELGIFHQATLRTYALPEEVACVDLELKSLDTLAQQITDWMISPASPDAIALRRLGDAWHLEVSYFGRAKANNVQVNALKKSLIQLDGFEVTDERRTPLAEHLKHNQHSRAWQRKTKTLMKIITPPRHLAAVTNTFAELGITQLSSLPAHGCLFAGGALTQDIDEKILELLTDCGGIRSWIILPHRNPRKFAPSMGTPAVNSQNACLNFRENFRGFRGEWAFMWKIKLAMDPDGLFNPGRFLKCEGGK